MLCFLSALQVLNLVQTQDVQRCTTLKTILATLTAIVDDLFSVGNQRLQLFETVLKILSGSVVFDFCDNVMVVSDVLRDAKHFQPLTT